jgi:hypothetical protein
MANTRTLVGQIPNAFQSLPSFRATSGAGLYMLKLAFDTTGGDLEILTPQSDGYIAILGWQHVGSADHVLTFAYADDAAGTNRAALHDLNFKAGSGISKDVNGEPMLIGQVGKSLLVRTSVQPISIIVYAAEIKQFRL